MHRRRPRTFTLWVGTLLSLLIVVAFVVSGWHLIGVEFTAQGPAVEVTEGCCFFIWISPGGGTFLAIPTSQLPGRQRMPNWELWNPWNVLVPEEGIFIPLYAHFLAVAVPTLLAWRFWPKSPKPGHCGCGYNLTGNVSGVCPECRKRAEKVKNRSQVCNLG